MDGMSQILENNIVVFLYSYNHITPILTVKYILSKHLKTYNLTYNRNYLFSILFLVVKFEITLEWMDRVVPYISQNL